VRKVFFVKNNRSGKVLNLSGGWSRGFTSYRVATFETEAEALLAVPPGEDCRVLSGSVSEKEAEEGDRFMLLGPGNRYLGSEGTFKETFRGALLFSSEDEALDRAEELGLHLDSVDVVRTTLKEK
jgi:hypothetical protein